MADRYDIKGTIGRGGVGAIYRAFDTVMGRNVAIKRLLPIEQTHLNEAADESLRREAAALARLNHPNILTIYAFEEDEDGPYVVTEMIEGEDLKKTIERGALPFEDFKEVVEQTLDPLISAHAEGLLHRDLKPANIMLQWLSTGKFQIKILDFGLAKFSQQPSLQTLDQTGSFLGSIDYIAPEQIDLKPLDSRTDLYSLGCVYYYTLVQRPPFEGKTPALTMRRHLEHTVTPIHQVREDLPEAVADWVMRLISLNPEDRPPDATAALKEFSDASEGISPIPVAIPVLDVATAPQAIAAPEETGPRTASGKLLVTGEAAALRHATAPRSRSTTQPKRATTIPVRKTEDKSLKGPLIALAACIILTAIIVPLVISKARSQKGNDGAGQGRSEQTESAKNSAPTAASRPRQKNQSSGIPPLPSKTSLPMAHTKNLPPSLPKSSDSAKASLRPPVVEGLIGNYRAESLTFREDLKTPAKENDHVAAWGNLAHDRPYHYLARLNDRKDKIPRLVRADRNRFSALNRDHELIEFPPDSGLRVRPSEEQNLGLDQQQLSFFAVLRSERPNGHIIKFDGNNDAWNFMNATAQKDRYQLSIRSDAMAGDGEPTTRAKIEQNAPTQQFVILSARWDGVDNEQILRVTRSNGTLNKGKPGNQKTAPVALHSYVIGNPNKGKPKPKALSFTGLIAAVLVYARALSDGELKEVEDYLYQYYFKKP
jgi:serine/threonine protein kinase